MLPPSCLRRALASASGVLLLATSSLVAVPAEEALPTTGEPSLAAPSGVTSAPSGLDLDDGDGDGDDLARPPSHVEAEPLQPGPKIAVPAAERLDDSVRVTATPEACACDPGSGRSPPRRLSVL